MLQGLRQREDVFPVLLHRRRRQGRHKIGVKEGGAFEAEDVPVGVHDLAREGAVLGVRCWDWRAAVVRLHGMVDMVDLVAPSNFGQG
jgi:hypothetical protein